MKSRRPKIYRFCEASGGTHKKKKWGLFVRKAEYDRLESKLRVWQEAARELRGVLRMADTPDETLGLLETIEQMDNQ